MYYRIQFCNGHPPHQPFGLLTAGGSCPPADLVQIAQGYGMTALGLPNHNLATSALEFVRPCQRADFQPILGLEVDIEGMLLHILATSYEGCSNLCRLSSATALNESPLSLDLPASHSKELITLSVHPGSVIVAPCILTLPGVKPYTAPLVYLKKGPLESKPRGFQ